MDIILKKDVENLGLEFDTVSVKPGYARNYLLPQGLALLATPKNKANLAETLEARKDVEEKLIADANAIVDQLKKTNITIATKVGSGDKLFGSINNANLSEELSKVGIQVDKKYIKIPGNNIKRTGKSTAVIRLHRNVEYNFDFDIVSDAPPVAAAPKAAPAKPKAAAEEEETTTEEA